jgi:hypothetical protein
LTARSPPDTCPEAGRLADVGDDEGAVIRHRFDQLTELEAHAFERRHDDVACRVSFRVIDDSTGAPNP